MTIMSQTPFYLIIRKNSMSDTGDKKQRRKSQMDAYAQKIHRSTYAIRLERVQGLDDAIAAAGCEALSELLTKLSFVAQEGGAALKKVFDATTFEMPERAKRVGTVKSAMAAIKDSGLTPAQIEEAIKRAVAEAG